MKLTRTVNTTTKHAQIYTISLILLPDSLTVLFKAIFGLEPWPFR